jgi:hypothetical protein
MAQSSNDSFPSAMCIAAAVNGKERLIPAVTAIRLAPGAGRVALRTARVRIVPESCTSAS